MPELILYPFGVGDGAACADRNHSSYLYQFPGHDLLIDCGEPVSRCFKASGRSYESIERIFISHLHFDHIGGLFMLLQGFWLEQRRKELPIFMPAEGIEPVRRMLQAGYLFDELLPFKLHFEALTAGQPISAGEVRVTPFPTSHLAEFRQRFAQRYPVGFSAFSFLLETRGQRIGHSADLGSPRDLEPLLQEPLDLLVCELAHFRAKDLFAYLRGKPIRRLALTHVGRSYWEKLEDTEALARTMLPEANLMFLRDGAELFL